jgi:hypothetical protein
VLGPQRLLVDAQAALKKRFGVAEAAVLPVQHGQAVDRYAHECLLGPERLLVDRKAASVYWLGLSAAALAMVDEGQPKQRFREPRMLLAILAGQRDVSFSYRKGVGVLALTV